MQPMQPIQHLSNVYVREEDGETYSDEYPYLGEYQDQIPLSVVLGFVSARKEIPNYRHQIGLKVWIMV
jgi:hypothetical protein